MPTLKIEDEGMSLLQFQEELAQIYADLLQGQEPLGAEFEPDIIAPDSDGTFQEYEIIKTEILVSGEFKSSWNPWGI